MAAGSRWRRARSSGSCGVCARSPVARSRSPCTWQPEAAKPGHAKPPRGHRPLQPEQALLQGGWGAQEPGDAGTAVLGHITKARRAFLSWACICSACPLCALQWGHQRWVARGGTAGELSPVHLEKHSSSQRLWPRSCLEPSQAGCPGSDCPVRRPWRPRTAADSRSWRSRGQSRRTPDPLGGPDTTPAGPGCGRTPRGHSNPTVAPGPAPDVTTSQGTLAGGPGWLERVQQRGRKIAWKHHLRSTVNPLSGHFPRTHPHGHAGHPVLAGPALHGVRLQVALHLEPRSQLAIPLGTRVRGTQSHLAKSGVTFCFRDKASDTLNNFLNNHPVLQI